MQIGDFIRPVSLIVSLCIVKAPEWCHSLTVWIVGMNDITAQLSWSVIKETALKNAEKKVPSPRRSFRANYTWSIVWLMACLLEPLTAKPHLPVSAPKQQQARPVSPDNIRVPVPELPLCIQASNCNLMALDVLEFWISSSPWRLRLQ